MELALVDVNYITTAEDLYAEGQDTPLPCERSPFVYYGDDQARFALGCMYLYGQAVKKDIFKAACWFANMNNLNSFDMRTEFFDLAEEYRTGDNVERDIDKAIDWYERIILCGAGDYI